MTNIENTDNWVSVAYGDGKFVAVGSILQTIVSDDDGQNWSKVFGGWDNFSFKSTVRSIAYGNNMLVVVGSGKYHIHYSYNFGQTWHPMNILDSNGEELQYALTDIVFVEEFGYFVATTQANRNGGMESDLIVFSKDGVNWSESSTGTDASHWNKITYADDKLVAVGTGPNLLMILGELGDGDKGVQDLYFNGDLVLIDTGLQGSLATLLSTQSRKVGRTKYYQDSALPTGDSYDYPDGSLWYQPTSNKVNFYNDSDQTWVQL
jgi:photosystem II stability/assembly factor-like uncharacterized protein